MFHLDQINVWGTVAAGLAVYALGAVWFSPVLFMNAWSQSLGRKPGERGSPLVAMGLTFVTTMITAFAMALLFQVGDIDTTLRGLLVGALIGFGIAGTSSLSDALFVGNLRQWWVIQVAFRVVSFLVMGAILGAAAPQSPLRKAEQQMKETGTQIQDFLEKNLPTPK
jgi:MFS family permease